MTEIALEVRVNIPPPRPPLLLRAQDHLHHTMIAKTPRLMQTPVQTMKIR